ncbi:hypothetical protein MW871_00350 [Flavobacterium sp. I-SCBP12n]|uniref:Uncharacterized protein n=1 Tax=Flavobacterium pygoscelis TaxID=2893176 RepID=A0A9X2BJL1_9FLAO|nr:hypothetical protein [Flavobacterium pygoscelis]MCK8140332.1 hypothetical protein [Flavobacterium pygoscelis]
MKAKFLMLLLLCSAFIQAQKIRWDNVNVRREVAPSLFLKESPLNVALICTTFDSGLSSDPTMRYQVFENAILYNDFIYNNFGLPEIVALLEYKFAPATVHLVKQDLKYKVAVVSHLYANLILIDRSKGFFDEQEVRLGEIDLVHPIANIKGFNSNLGFLDYPNNLNTTLVIDDLTEFEANQYKNKTNPSLPRSGEEKSVNEIQLLKLKMKVGSILRGKFLPTARYQQRSFNYLKEDKDFKSDNFDKALQLVKSGVDPVNESKVREAISIWQTEADAITNLDDKKTKKYYIALQENILQGYNVIRDFQNTDELASKLKSIDSNNEIANALISNKKNAALPQPPQKEIVFAPVPARFDRSDVKRFLDKKSGKINAIVRLQPDKYEGKLGDMNTYKAASEVFRKSQVNSTSFNAILSLFLQIAEYERTGVNYDQVKEVKEVLKSYNAFCLQLAKERKAFDATYDFKNQAASYMEKLRLHLLSLHKKEEFTVFDDALSTAITATIAHTKPENQQIARDIIDLNTAVTLKANATADPVKNQVIIDRLIDNVTAFFAKKVPNQQYEVFFEFDNSAKLLKQNKSISAVELGNFSSILCVLYFYL